MFFPVIQTGDFVALQAASGLAAQNFRVGVIQFPMQQQRDHRTDLWNGNRRRQIFSPAGFLA